MGKSGKRWGAWDLNEALSDTEAHFFSHKRAHSPTSKDPAALLFSRKRALDGQVWEAVAGCSPLPALWLEKLFMNSACLNPGSPATPAGAFHRRPSGQVIEHHTEPLSAGHGVLQRRVCVGHAAGGGEVVATSLSASEPPAPGEQRGGVGSLGQAKPKGNHGRKMVWAVFRARDKEFLEGLNWVLCHETTEDSRKLSVHRWLRSQPCLLLLGWGQASVSPRSLSFFICCTKRITAVFFWVW